MELFLIFCLFCYRPLNIAPIVFAFGAKCINISKYEYLLCFYDLQINKNVIFLYRSVHPFKSPVILNVAIGLTFDGIIFNFLLTETYQGSFAAL
jgi:hypothetical protein